MLHCMLYLKCQIDMDPPPPTDTTTTLTAKHLQAEPSAGEECILHSDTLLYS